MGNLSKYFYEATRNLTCADFIHPNMSCTTAALHSIRDGFLGASKFYFPVCFVPMFFKMSKWHTKEPWLQFLNDYARCVTVGFSIAGLSFVYFCIIYNTIKFIHMPTFIFLPSLISTFYCGFLPEKMLMDGLGLFNMYIEFYIKQSRIPLIKFMRRSRLSATFLFMFFNAAVMYGMSKTQKHRFWVISPGNLKKAKPEDSEEITAKPSWLFDKILPTNSLRCLHKHLTCDDYLKKECKKAIKFALAINFIKILLPNFQKIVKNPSKLLEICVRKFDYGLFAFLVGINGSYTFTQCLLNRHDNRNIDKNSLIAGFLAGVCYAFCPKYVIFTLGSTASIEMLWKSACTYYKENSKELPKIMNFISKMPIRELIFSFAIGIMFNLRVVYPYYTNQFVHKFMAIGTLNKTEFLAENYASIMMGLKAIPRIK